MHVSSNPENRNKKASLYECKCKKDNKNVNSIATDVHTSKRKMLHPFASVICDATDNDVSVRHFFVKVMQQKFEEPFFRV